jgi:hypothetical protein
MKPEERDTVIEECAKVCDKIARSEACYADRVEYVAEDCAAAIRALTALHTTGVHRMSVDDMIEEMRARRPPRSAADVVACRCRKCGHTWIAAYLPMNLTVAGKLLKRAACARCGDLKPVMASDAERLALVQREHAK